MTEPTILIGIPTYDRKIQADQLYPLVNACHEFNVEFAVVNTSLLAYGFNLLWSMALNRRDKITHFVMLHADVVPELDWLPKLYGEIERLKADVVSVVIPLKEDSGITSMAIGDMTSDWQILKRLTLREVHQLPETFDADDAGYGARPLLVNTGLFIADMRRRWVTNVHFEILDRIVKKDGKYEAQTVSEDWRFSRWLWELGAKVYATRKVSVLHAGIANFPNSPAWGTKETDDRNAG